MKIGGYLWLVTSGLFVFASCSTRIELTDGAAAGEAGVGDEAGVAGASDEAGGAGANNVGGTSSASAGAPMHGDGGSDSVGGAATGGVGVTGASGGSADQDGGAGGAGDLGPSVPGLEYRDSFNSVGAWVLTANPDTDTATAEIAQGKLELDTDQGYHCPKASATLALPQLTDTPAGTTTLWKFQLVDIFGAAAGSAPLILSRPPRQVTVDLMTLGDASSGELVVNSAPAGVTVTYNGVTPKYLDMSFNDGYQGPASIAVTAEACGADAFAGATVGMSSLQIVSVP